MGARQIEESEALARLKDRFIRFWPKLVVPVVDLEGRFLNANDRVLVVGSGRILRLQGPNVTNTDLAAFAGVSVVCDVQNLCFAEDSFDAVVSHQVLEHVPDSDRSIAEMLHVLKPGALVLASVPFFFPFHAAPHDFRRWTIPGLRLAFECFEEIETEIYYGPMCGLLSGMRWFVGMLFPNIYLSHAAMALVGYVLFPLRYLDYLLVRLPNAGDLAAGLYYVGRKPADPSAGDQIGAKGEP